MPELPDPHARRVSRRAALGVGLAAGLAGGAAVSGCSVERSEPSSASSSAPADGTPASGSSVSPDVAVATAALGAVLAAQDAVRATTQRFPSLPGLSGLSALHEAHRRSLADAVPDDASSTPTTPSYVVPRGRERALTRLDGVETRLHATLQGLALRAESGDFARLLATMAAGISVRRVGG